MTSITKAMKLKNEKDEQKTEKLTELTELTEFKGYKYKSRIEAYAQIQKNQKERRLIEENKEKSNAYSKHYYQTVTTQGKDYVALIKKIDEMIKNKNNGVVMTLSEEYQLFKDMANSLFGNRADAQLNHSLFKITPRLPLGASDKLSDEEKRSQNFIFSKPPKPTFAEMDNGFFGSMI
jgi:hypothetical protein